MNKILLVLFLISAQFHYSQSISGNIIDSVTQNAISNAKVVITNLNTGSVDSTFSNSFGNWIFNFTTSASDKVEAPISYLISQNYPNPFNPSTTIEFSIPKASEVQILIHDILGQQVDSRSQFLNVGNYSITWNARGSAGVYFYTIKTSDESITKK